MLDKTWGARLAPPGQTKAIGQFWPNAIKGSKALNPDFCYVAECYWDREYELQVMSPPPNSQCSNLAVTVSYAPFLLSKAVERKIARMRQSRPDYGRMVLAGETLQTFLSCSLFAESITQLWIPTGPISESILGSLNPRR